MKCLTNPCVKIAFCSYLFSTIIQFSTWTNFVPRLSNVAGRYYFAVATQYSQLYRSLKFSLLSVLPHPGATTFSQFCMSCSHKLTNIQRRPKVVEEFLDHTKISKSTSGNLKIFYSCQLW